MSALNHGFLLKIWKLLESSMFLVCLLLEVVNFWLSPNPVFGVHVHVAVFQSIKNSHLSQTNSEFLIIFTYNNKIVISPYKNDIGI